MVGIEFIGDRGTASQDDSLPMDLGTFLAEARVWIEEPFAKMLEDFDEGHAALDAQIHSFTP